MGGYYVKSRKKYTSVVKHPAHPVLVKPVTLTFLFITITASELFSKSNLAAPECRNYAAQPQEVYVYLPRLT